MKEYADKNLCIKKRLLFHRKLYFLHESSDTIQSLLWIVTEKSQAQICFPYIFWFCKSSKTGKDSVGSNLLNNFLEKKRFEVAHLLMKFSHHNTLLAYFKPTFTKCRFIFTMKISWVKGAFRSTRSSITKISVLFGVTF